MNRKHIPFMLMVFAALFFGVWAGLIRSGWRLPNLHDDFALAHGVLMIGGFLGTLISLERATALHGFAKAPQTRTLPYLVPMLSAAGALSLIVDLSLAAVLMSLSSFGLVLIFAYIIHKQTAFYTITMGLGALCWLWGNLIWLAGEPLYMSAGWWMAFLVLTIAGERLELARLMRHARSSLYLFMIAVGLLLLGLLLIHFNYDAGMRLMGVGNIGVAFWLMRYDVIRRTIRQNALPRFIAVCLGLGYVWLALSGAMAVYYGGVKAGLIYDALLHSTFLGFAFSMIFGHAPIILPAVLRINIGYSSLFYGHLALLHLSLVLRVGGDLSAWHDGRRWGAMLNALVLILFLLNTARMLQTAESKPIIPRSQRAYITYALALPLFLIGVVLVGAGLFASLKGADEPTTSPRLDAIPSDQASNLDAQAPSLDQTEAIAAGERAYQSTCAACHGSNLAGIRGIGSNLITSEFVRGQSDPDLQAFILRGRPSWDAANTTGVDMPPRGGNPALTDAQIQEIITFIRFKASE